MTRRMANITLSTLRHTNVLDNQTYWHIKEVQTMICKDNYDRKVDVVKFLYGLANWDYMREDLRSSLNMIALAIITGEWEDCDGYIEYTACIDCEHKTLIGE